MRILQYFILLINFAACNYKRDAVKSENIIDSLSGENIVAASRDNHELYLHTEKKFTNSLGLNITIQNSFPKGGPFYSNNGTQFACAVFWSRFINESTKPLELTIQFPVDSFLVFNSAEAYLKLLLPSDTMTIEKLGLYNNGATGLQTFINENMHQPKGFHQIIQAGDDFMFYTAAISYKEGGVVRSGFEIVNSEVIFSISISPHFENFKVTCGKIKLQ